MPLNEKIRTEDVIELLDGKVLTTQGHPTLGVLPRENYNSVLFKLAKQILTPAEKLALDNTLTAPSASNPVVLKDDLQTYIPAADFGEVKDSVPAFSNLPLTGNTVGDLRAVLNDRIIYRWGGTAPWVPFIMTGTLDHTQLGSQDGNPAYQHLTATEKTTLITQSHIHSNQAVLDHIIAAGSGQIITTPERLRLPNQNEKDALQGTSGLPSLTNPYVTSGDTRLLTVRNPYVTIGPPGSLASFTGVDFRPFQDAITAISVGSASAVKAIEVLPGFYTIGGVSLIWDSQQAALTIEAFSPGTVTLSFQTFMAGIRFLDSVGDKGQVTFRGFVIELNDLGTSGILTTRANTLIENCIFRPGPTTSVMQVGITLDAPNCVVRKCVFLNELETGIEIKNKNCRVEDCTFNLSQSSSHAIKVLEAINTEGVEISRCTFLKGKVEIYGGGFEVRYTTVANNYFSPDASLIDNGYSSRILENMPQEINQPYVARKKTIGYPGTYADYRGTTDAIFTAALSDPLVTEIEVLPGSYQFSNAVLIPIGKAVRGVTQGSTGVAISSLTTGLFVMQSSTTLENLDLSSTNAPTVSTDSTMNVEIRRCTVSLLAENTPDDWGVYAVNTTDLQIDRCIFDGAKGCKVSGGTRAKIENNIFETTLRDFEIVSVTDCDIEHNHFEETSSDVPVFSGTRLSVDGNLFLGNVPTKVNTENSAWFGNYPDPLANNLFGVDTVVLCLDSHIEPISGGVSRTTTQGVGALAFTGAADGAPPSQNGVAATLPVKIPARLNPALGYSVDVYWTAPLAGTVTWSVTTTFRSSLGSLLGSVSTYSGLPTTNKVDDSWLVTDSNTYYRWNGSAWFVANVIGGSVTQTVSTTRTSLAMTSESFTSFAFSNLDYQLPAGTMPSHVSVTVTRVANDPNDTMDDTAYVTDVQITLPRD